MMFFQGDGRTAVVQGHLGPPVLLFEWECFLGMLSLLYTLGMSVMEWGCPDSFSFIPWVSRAREAASRSDIELEILDS